MIRELGGEVTLHYVPEDVLDSPERLYELYYGGPNRIEIGRRYYRNSGCANLTEITDGNLEGIVDQIAQCLEGDVGPQIQEALRNFGKEGELLKYFDREPELLHKFRGEVLKLKLRWESECI